MSGESVLNGNGVTGPAASDADAGKPKTTDTNGEEAPAATAPVVSDPSNAAAAPSEPQPAAVAQVPESETKKEPQAGDKRELDDAPDSDNDSKAASKDAPAAEHDKPEPEAKKQKTEISSAEPAPADEKNINGGPKKAGRPKKDKAKDVLKKIVPTDSIGSRTRSRTKAA